MKKRIVAIILALILLFSVSVNAYDIEGYDLTCDAAMLVNLDTDEVLYAKNDTEILYPASITKLMTALVMLEHITDLENTELVYTKEAAARLAGTGSAAYGLRIGETLSAKDALASLLVSSHGDAAYAIAEHVGGTIDRFIEMMNEKAVEMGLANTRYTNPVGLHDDNHYTTAREIVKLAKCAFENDTIRHFASLPSYTMSATNYQEARTIYNSNPMLNPQSDSYYPYTVCSKTGFTSQAGRCLVSIAEHGDYRYMALVLNSKKVNGVRRHVTDSTNLYRWAFESFAYATVVDGATPITQISVNLSKDADTVSLVPDTEFKALLPVDADLSAVSVVPHPNAETVDAPITKGDLLGTADVVYENRVIGTVNLVAASDVAVNEWLQFWKNTPVMAGQVFTSPWMIPVYVILALVLIFALMMVYTTVKKNKRRRDRRTRSE